MIVLTGPPGAGKSSALRELSERGFPVLPETYRWLRVFLLTESGEPRATMGPSRGSMGTIWDLQFAFERYREDSELGEPSRYFCDRSLIDLYAYAVLYAPQWSAHLHAHARHTASRILRAYFLTSKHDPPKDWLRSEDSSQADAIATALCNAYRGFGVEPISAPHLLTVQEVVDWILRDLETL